MAGLGVTSDKPAQHLSPMVVALLSKLTQLSDINPGGDHEKPSG